MPPQFCIHHSRVHCQRKGVAILSFLSQLILLFFACRTTYMTLRRHLHQYLRVDKSLKSRVHGLGA